MLTFLKQFVVDQYHTGSVVPSSQFLARAMTRAVNESRRPGESVSILEVGPGTGPVTKRILKLLRDGDTLHIVEINPAFCEQLERRLLGPFRAARPNVQVVLHQCGLEVAQIPEPVDHIVCSLPFNNFQPAFVRQLFRRMLSLLKTDGTLTYFEYAGMRLMKGVVSGSAERRRLRSVGAVGAVLSRRHAGQRRLVIPNVPPAYARSIRVLGRPVIVSNSDVG